MPCCKSLKKIEKIKHKEAQTLVTSTATATTTTTTTTTAPRKKRKTSARCNLVLLKAEVRKRGFKKEIKI